MRVYEFNITKDNAGIDVSCHIQTDALIRFTIPIHLKMITGFDKLENEKLDGERDFNWLSIRTKPIRSMEQAKRAATELKAILDNIQYSEALTLNSMTEIEDYLKTEFENLLFEEVTKNTEGDKDE